MSRLEAHADRVTTPASLGYTPAPRLSTAPTRPGGVEHWAEEKPAELAIVEGDRRCTWAELNDSADRLATALAAEGLREGDVLAVRTRTRMEWAVAAAAASKLGCTLLCVNWRLTPPETAFILRNAHARAMICDDEAPAELATAWSDIAGFIAVSIDVPAAGFHAYDRMLQVEPRRYRSAANAPLVIFTSGTTGFPKGVAAAPPLSPTLTEYRADVSARGNQQPGDVTLVNVPLHHGMGASFIHGAFDGGNMMVLMRRFDAEASLAAIAEHRVTFWFAVPTMLQRIAALPAETLARYDRSSLRSVMTGTAPVPFALKQWVVERFGVALTEGYGSTETGMISSLGPAEQLVRPGSSGRPYRHVDIKIVDPDGRTLPTGETGEILVRTPAVIRGYLGMGPLDPSAIDPEGFFRMGDAGHLDPDGYLYITDRVKDMIIAGGVNIYPAEIEAALETHPGVLAAAAIGVPHDEYGEEVIAFFEAKPGVLPGETELLAHCATSLASYKRPRRLIMLDELPRNTMGKIEKQVLRAPYWTGRDRRV